MEIAQTRNLARTAPTYSATFATMSICRLSAVGTTGESVRKKRNELITNKSNFKTKTIMLVLELVGYIGNDAEIKNFNGQNYIAFNVATQDKYKDAMGNTVSRTTWVSCLKHETTASALVQYLKKGTQVFVRGDLSAKTFNSQQSVQVSINCRVRELQLVGGKGESNQQGAQTTTSQQAQGFQPQQSNVQPPAGTAPAQGNGQNDLPF